MQRARGSRTVPTVRRAASLALCSAAPDPTLRADAPDLATEEARTVDALGVALAASVSSFDLSAEGLDLLLQGLADGSSAILGSGSVGDIGAGSGDPAIRGVLVELRAGGAQLVGQVASATGEARAGVIFLAVIRTAQDRADEGSRPGLGPEVLPGGVADAPVARLFTTAVETDRRGHYAIRGLPPGSLTLAARMIGGKPAVRLLQLLDGDALTVDFTLPDVADPFRRPRPKRMAAVPVPPADAEP